MTNITIDLPDDLAARLREQAEKDGLELSDFLAQRIAAEDAALSAAINAASERVIEKNAALYERLS